MPEVTLYRCKTPTDWLCPCGRTARALRRHGVEFEEIRLTRADRTAVDDITGQVKIPVLVIDGEAIADSQRIIEHLEWRSGHDDPLAGGTARGGQRAG